MLAPEEALFCKAKNWALLYSIFVLFYLLLLLFFYRKDQFAVSFVLLQIFSVFRQSRGRPGLDSPTGRMYSFFASFQFQFQIFTSAVHNIIS